MKSHARVSVARAPWGLLAAVAVGAAAVWLTVAQGLPSGCDSGFHLYRLIERDDLIRQGVLYSRWSPFLGYGYGSPLFNYYPPLLYYLAELFNLAGSGPLMALQITLGLALVVGAVGMYCWIRDLFGAGPGVVAAIAFVFSPYVMYTLVDRAGFAEILALAWMPWGLWATERFGSKQAPIYGVACAVLVAATLITHLFSAYSFLATLAIYCVVTNLIGSGRSIRLRRLRTVLWPIGLGLGLAAFFWLPAMWESNHVQIEQMLTVSDPRTGRGLMPLWQVFDTPWIRRGTSVAMGPTHLSWFGGLLALVGAVAGLGALRSHNLRIRLLTGVLLAAMAVSMLTPGARWLWQTVPMLHLAQFPFRFLGIASVWVAMLAGAGAAASLALLSSNVRCTGRGRLASAAIVAGLGLALVLCQKSQSGAVVNASHTPTDVDAAVGFERTFRLIGLQATMESVPRAIRRLPPAESGPRFGESRLDATSMPASVRVVSATYDLLNYTIVVDSPEPFRAVIRTFYFPGWWARVSEQPVPIAPTDPFGLISLAVPAGKQRIEIGFGSTPVRTAATGLSIGSVLGLAWLLTRQATKRAYADNPASKPVPVSAIRGFHG